MMDRAIRQLFNLTAPPPMIWEPSIIGNLDNNRPDFKTRVRKTIAKIPEELQASLLEAKYKVSLTSTIKAFCDSSPIYRDDSIPDSASAFFSHHYKTSVIPQKKKNILKRHNTDPDLSFNNNPEHTAAHEIGHAIAHLLINRDQNPYCEKFKGTIREEIFQVYESGNAFDALRWHDQVLIPDFSRDTVYSEFFAELFAEIITNKNNISKFFPRTKLLVEKIINDLIQEFRTANPDFDPETYPKMDVAVA